MKLRQLLALLIHLCAPAVFAQDSLPGSAASRPLWLRYGAISPDGRQIAFAFQGNLFVVPVTGGDARLIVDNGHHSFSPVWSPDGRNIAYASDVHGNFDVFLINAAGGTSKRLTTNSASEVPSGFTPDGQQVVFSARLMDSPGDVQFPLKTLTQLYEVPVEEGRRPHQILTTPALAAQFDKAGQRLLYEDWKAYENPWRKHHIGPSAHDIWIYDVKTNAHRRLTNWGGENRNPVWSADEQTVYYLSEKGGSFNVWKMPIEHPDAAQQVTYFTHNPVRFLSRADDGTLSFGYDGELYVLAPGDSQPRRVDVTVRSDTRTNQVENIKASQGATEMSVSPDGKEVAFVLRGQIFVGSTEFGETRRVAEAQGQQRGVNFGPTGRTLVYSSELDGHWNLYEASLADDKKDSPYFFHGAHVQVRTILKNTHENQQPHYSPDGKEVAYLEDRTALKILNLATGQTRLILPGEANFSYRDGDQWFDWSPDGRSILVQFMDRERYGGEVGLIDATGRGTLHDLSQSGYDNAHPIWTNHGTALMWFSDRMGLHGTVQTGQPGDQRDVFEMFLTQDGLDRFRLDKGGYALLQRQDDRSKPGLPSRDKLAAAAAMGAASAPAASAVTPVKADMNDLQDRVVRLTPFSGDIRAAVMTPDGETLLVLLKSARDYELWSIHPRVKDFKKVATFADKTDGDNITPTLSLDAAGQSGFLLAFGTIQKFAIPKEGDIKVEPVAFSAEMKLDHTFERTQMFEHVWRQMRDKFYAVDMNGVGWAAYRKVYAKFLPYLADNYDFQECVSELLGELNVSHTGVGIRTTFANADDTGALGLFLDNAWTGAGLKVAELLAEGPLTRADSALRAGMIVEAIDGTAVSSGAEFDSLLDHKAGQWVRLSIFDASSGKRFEQAVKPISQSQQGELLYRRWVKKERAIVERLSSGQLGYVHVRSMDEDSYRNVYSEVLGRESGKRALIVDTRFNGGGNLHDALATLLSGNAYLEFQSRGQSFGHEPTTKWNKPSIVLINESNYSDATLFPWVYRHLGIGKLVGSPVAGTGTGVWWESLSDSNLYFGNPELGLRDVEGVFMEKIRIDPDLLVLNDPTNLSQGRDQQLEAAVAELMKH